MSASLTKIDERLSTKRRALAEAIDARQALYDSVDALADEVDALEAKEDATDEDLASLTGKLADMKAKNKQAVAAGETIRGLEAEISSLETQRREREEHNRQTAVLNNVQPRNSTPENPGVSGSNITVQDLSNEELDHGISSFFRNSFLARKMNLSLAAVCAGQAGEQYRNDHLHAAITKTSDPSILPANYRPRLIEHLRPRTVVRRMQGLVQMPLPNGNLRIPRQNATASASYTAEMANIATSQPGTDQITLSAKKLTAMVIQSGEMMRHANPSTDALIRNDIIKVVSLTEDSTFIRAAGSSLIPKGLKAFADAASATQVVTANGTVNLANVTTDIGKLLLALANANCPNLNPYFIMSPRTERYLMDLRDGNGNYAFPEMARGQLRGVPYLTTTQIPNNLTVAAVPDCSELYLVDASEYIIADTDTFELNVSIEAAYHDGSAVQAAFSQDAAVFRLIVEHDTAIRHNESVAYLEKVTWGV